MSKVRRIYVEKKDAYAVKAKDLKKQFKDYLGIKADNVRVLTRYDMEGVSEDTYNKAKVTIFSEPPIDVVYEESFPMNEKEKCFSQEYLPGQFDQRADSAEQCVKLLNEEETPVIKTATTYVVEGDVTEEQMQTIRQLFRENPDYVKLLSEPSIPKEERTKLLDTAFGTEAERYLVNFLKLLCERGILGEYSGCCEEFTRRYNVDHNIATAVVTSAVALTDEQMAALKDKLEKISGKTVTLTQKTDPTVLAGLKVELEGKQLDGTVKSRLDGLSRKLNELIV